MILESELILNPDGSIYHLHLKPGQVADTVILVGDPGRVTVIESYLSDVEYKVVNREYISITGTYNGKRITVVSTGVGVGNIDIVMNELDALVNIDFETREIKKNLKKLDFIRIGTSGSIQEDIPVNSFVLSQKSVGFDNLLYFYDVDKGIINETCGRLLRMVVGGHSLFLNPYVIDASEELFNTLKSEKTKTGITISSPGFYVPQGRELRLTPKLEDINKKLSDFEYEGLKITNYEMEISAMCGLARMLGHNAIGICLIIANRLSQKVNKNYRDKIRELIEYVLHKITHEN